MKKFVFYFITVILNIIYYTCKPAELFSKAINFRGIIDGIKNIPHWIMESFTDPGDIDYDEDEYLDYTFNQKAA